MPRTRAAGGAIIICVMMMSGGAAAQAVTAAQTAPQISAAPKSVYELAFIKAELEALQAMVLLSPKVTPELQEQIAAIKARLAAALSLDAASSSSKQSLVPVRDSARPLEVNVTGSTGQTQIARAELLVQRGDIAGARLVLEHALAHGNPLAAFRLAETYDPERLRSLRVVGVKGDAEKARELYAKARLGGAEPGRMAGLR